MTSAFRQVGLPRPTLRRCLARSRLRSREVMPGQPLGGRRLRLPAAREGTDGHAEHGATADGNVAQDAILRHTPVILRADGHAACDAAADENRDSGTTRIPRTTRTGRDFIRVVCVVCVVRVLFSGQDTGNRVQSDQSVFWHGITSWQRSAEPSKPEEGRQSQSDHHARQQPVDRYRRNRIL